MIGRSIWADSKCGIKRNKIRITRNYDHLWHEKKDMKIFIHLLNLRISSLYSKKVKLLNFSCLGWKRKWKAWKRNLKKNCILWNMIYIPLRNKFLMTSWFSIPLNHLLKNKLMRTKMLSPSHLQELNPNWRLRSLSLWHMIFHQPKIRFFMGSNQCQGTISFQISIQASFMAIIL